MDALGRILNIRGEVVPITWDDCHLFAELENKTIVAGEANIDVPQHDGNIPISHVFLEPEAQINPDAHAAIVNADAIVLAPGDLYTSSVANLLVNGVSEALAAANAPLVYVLNLMTKYGETNNFTASHHLEQIRKYGGRVPDLVLAHRGDVPEDLVKKYEAENAHRVNVDEGELRKMGVQDVQFADIMSSDSLVRHDPGRTATALLKLLDTHAA